MSRGMNPGTSNDEGDRRHLGLGLYIVDKIVAAHGGRMLLTSDPANGTTFVLRLPRTDVKVHYRAGEFSSPVRPADPTRFQLFAAISSVNRCGVALALWQAKPLRLYTSAERVALGADSTEPLGAPGDAFRDICASFPANNTPANNLSTATSPPASIRNPLTSDGVSGASRRLRALAALSGSLTDALDPTEAADLVEQKALSALDATSAVVVTLGPFPARVTLPGTESDVLHVVHAIGLPNEVKAALEELPLDAARPARRSRSSWRTLVSAVRR